MQTRHGAARAYLEGTDDARAAVVLGHGAGGGVGAPDLQAAAAAALEQGCTVVLVEQPYRVAGRRSPAPAPQLDAALLEVVDHLRADALAGLPLVLGGRSSGARVACRTAADAGAAGVLCLAFPLLPPRRAGPPRSPAAASTSSTPCRSRCWSSRDAVTASGCRPEAPGGRSSRWPAITACAATARRSARPSPVADGAVPRPVQRSRRERASASAFG